MKKIPVILASLMLPAVLVVGISTDASAKDVLSEDGTTLLKKDVLMRRHSYLRIDTINELANSVTITPSYVPTSKSPTIFWMWGPNPEGGEAAITKSDKFLWDNTYAWDSESVLSFTRTVYLYKYNASSWRTLTLSGDRMINSLEDNTTYILYANGTNVGGVKVDYSRCVTAENYLAKKAVATASDTLECRLVTSNPSYSRTTWGDAGEEWYQPYFNGKKLEFTENDKANWLAAAKAEAEEINVAWQIAGYSESDSSDDGNGNDVENSGAGDSGNDSINDELASTSGVTITVESGHEDTSTDGVVGTSGESSGESSGTTSETSATNDESDGTTDKESVDDEVAIPVLGGECAEWPWWWVIVALVCGLGVGGISGYWLGQKHKDDTDKIEER